MKVEGAKLVEIFSSIQGEGMRVGEQMTFVRFQGCDLKCHWCDTPENFSPHAQFRIETERFSGQWEFESNPVSSERLTHWIEHFSDSMISLTGGEPLQQVDFLEHWLPTVSPQHSFLLETNGILPAALQRVLPWIHTVSMDIKLPSSAKTGTFWKEHEAFLKIAIEAPECYVKIVVTEKTAEQDLAQAFDCIRSVDDQLPVILQPVSQTRAFRESLSVQQLFRFVVQAHRALKKVRVIPQTHKLLEVL